jgi:hypothetical protein
MAATEPMSGTWRARPIITGSRYAAAQSVSTAISAAEVKTEAIISGPFREGGKLLSGEGDEGVSAD